MKSSLVIPIKDSYSTKEVAELLDCSKQTIRNDTTKLNLKPTKRSNTFYFTFADIKEIAKSHDIEIDAYEEVATEEKAITVAENSIDEITKAVSALIDEKMKEQYEEIEKLIDERLNKIVNEAFNKLYEEKISPLIERTIEESEQQKLEQKELEESKETQIEEEKKPFWKRWFS